MSDYTLTPNLGLFKPTPDADDNMWGDHWNANADTLDALLGAGGSLGAVTVRTLNISALPTSPSGLISGDIWSNGGVLMVVP